MRRATWGSYVSGRCCGVRESSSQRLTPKGTAPLLHCPDPRKARATFHGACPRPPRMAMPVARYTDVAGPDDRVRRAGVARSVSPRPGPRTPAAGPAGGSVPTPAGRPPEPSRRSAPRPHRTRPAHPSGTRRAAGHRCGPPGGVRLPADTGRPPGPRRPRRAAPRPSCPARPPSTVTCRVLPRRSAGTAAREAPRSARFPTSRPAEGAHRSDRTSWSCAGRTTGFRTRDRMFSANFRVESIPCRIGRSTPLPAGRKRPSGTLPPHGDGP